MPSTEPTLSTLPISALGPTEPPSVVTAKKAVSAAGAKGGQRRFPSAVQTAHFKAFWVKPLEGQLSEPDLVQTVIPKRLLKKAVDRNGLRRVLREAVRSALNAAKPKIEILGADALSAVAPVPTPQVPTPRVVLINAKGFAEQASRHALKGAWREELDRLMALLLLRLKA
jgi:Ribonuclease P